MSVSMPALPTTIGKIRPEYIKRRTDTLEAVVLKDVPEAQLELSRIDISEAMSQLNSLGASINNISSLDRQTLTEINAALLNLETQMETAKIAGLFGNSFLLFRGTLRAGNIDEIKNAFATLKNDMRVLSAHTVNYEA